jgi:hypothetical protein
MEAALPATQRGPQNGRKDGTDSSSHALGGGGVYLYCSPHSPCGLVRLPFKLSVFPILFVFLEGNEIFSFL